jgi:hypothetical protein
MARGVLRRDALKVAAAGGLLALGGSAASAAQEKNSPWTGEWLAEGKDELPCAIFQHGRVLLLINEHMHIAAGEVTAARKIVVRDALVWSDRNVAEAITGVLSPNGQVLTWANGSKWKRA